MPPALGSISDTSSQAGTIREGGWPQRLLSLLCLALWYQGPGTVQGNHGSTASLAHPPPLSLSTLHKADASGLMRIFPGWAGGLTQQDYSRGDEVCSLAPMAGGRSHGSGEQLCQEQVEVGMGRSLVLPAYILFLEWAPACAFSLT